MAILEEDLLIPLAEPAFEPAIVGDTSVTEGEDGSIVVGDYEDPAIPLSAAPHDANLVTYMDENDCDELGAKVCEMVEADESSRKEWENRLHDGMQVLGIAPRKSEDSPFENASLVTHPLVLEAGIQFASRAIEELQPSDGPVQTRIAPKAGEEVEARAQRVEDFLNYYLTEEDDDYQDDFDQMLFMMALHGTAFRKVYRDPETRLPVSRFVDAVDFIVPYSARNLKSASRYTHRIKMDYNDYLRAVQSGMYVAVEEMATPNAAAQDNRRELSDEVDSRQPASAQDDNERVLYECHCNLRLKGIDADEDPARPYIVTVDSETHKCVGIYRNWKADDAYAKKRVWFVKYGLLRGLGFYDLGFYHVLGQLGAAAGGLLRAIIDGAAIANVNGGFKPKMPGILAKDIRFKPGVYQDVDLTPEELAKAFYTPPFKEPGPALFDVLNLIVQSGQRLATTTETSVGDAKNTGPVGTTIALLDESRKVFSASHKRCHRSQRRELKMLAELFGETPNMEYPYQVNGEAQMAFAADFGPEVDVFPVSDPTISSSTQRIATAQTALELVNSAPDIFDAKAKRVAYKRMLHAIKMPRPDELLPDDMNLGPRLDPMTENMRMANGMPAQAYPDQAHEAHMQVHQAFLATLPPEGAQLQPVFLAHIAEHYAYNYRNQMAAIMQQQTGFQMPMISLPDSSEDLPPEIENQVALMQAQAAGQLAQMLMQQMAEQAAAAGPDPAAEADAESIRREQEIKDETHAREQARKDDAFAREQRRRDAATGSKIVAEASKGAKAPA